jgi:hypothetical protein
MLAGTFGALAYKKNNIEFYLQGIDKIMPANIAHMFHSRAEKGVLLFTAEESRAVIEWIDEKFSNQNRYVNYFIGTALMIGLLGTFSGLLVSIDQMGKIILSLTGDIDLGKVIRSFSGPLGGMATGFGSSLFGVITAIILGLMGYILNKNQETLIEGVEDWLKGRIIDSGNASPGAGGGMPSLDTTASELPEHRSSFIDVFIDNIASLTKEMAKISQTNERLHSITVASVQQARDEHETNLVLFEEIRDNVSNLNELAKSNVSILEEKLSALDKNMKSSNETITEVINSLSNIDSTLKEKFDNLNSSNESINEVLLQSKENLNSIQMELGELLDNLQENSLKEDENLENIVNSLSDLSSKLENENEQLNILEKLGKMQIKDIRKQNEFLSKGLNTQDETKIILKKQQELLKLLVGNNSDKLEEIERIEKISIEENNKKDEKKGFFSKLLG